MHLASIARSCEDATLEVQDKCPCHLEGSKLWKVDVRSKDAMAQGSGIEGSFEYLRNDREKESFF